MRKPNIISFVVSFRLPRDVLALNAFLYFHFVANKTSSWPCRGWRGWIELIHVFVLFFRSAKSFEPSWPPTRPGQWSRVMTARYVQVVLLSSFLSGESETPVCQHATNRSVGRSVGAGSYSLLSNLMGHPSCEPSIMNWATQSCLKLTLRCLIKSCHR